MWIDPLHQMLGKARKLFVDFQPHTGCKKLKPSQTLNVGIRAFKFVQRETPGDLG